MEANKMKFTNRNQLEALVSALQQNVEVARGHGKRGLQKEDTKMFWNTLSEKLNSIGPPSRDGAGWLKVWNDQKYAVKKKLQNNKKMLNATGGGPNRTFLLSQLDESIADMLQLEHAVSPPGSSFGLPTILHSDLEEVFEEKEPSNAPGTAPDTPVSNRPRKRKLNNEADERMALLKEQTELQKNILIEKKETNKYLRRILKIKEEKLKLLKEEFADKKRCRYELLKIKTQKLEQSLEQIMYQTKHYESN